MPFYRNVELNLNVRFGSKADIPAYRIRIVNWDERLKALVERASESLRKFRIFDFSGEVWDTSPRVYNFN